MVDFPEGYGFAPTKGRQLMQSQFTIEVGVFEPRKTNYYGGYSRPGVGKPPYIFDPIGFVAKDKDTPIHGVLYYRTGEPPIPHITGTLQQVVTAMCTLHRMKGHMK
jgi:hypothetical protein